MLPQKGNDICHETLLVSGSRRQQVIRWHDSNSASHRVFWPIQDLIKWLKIRDSFVENIYHYIEHLLLLQLTFTLSHTLDSLHCFVFKKEE
jgi:hypothetical protein